MRWPNVPFGRKTLPEFSRPLDLTIPIFKLLTYNPFYQSQPWSFPTDPSEMEDFLQRLDLLQLPRRMLSCETDCFKCHFRSDRHIGCSDYNTNYFDHNTIHFDYDSNYPDCGSIYLDYITPRSDYDTEYSCYAIQCFDRNIEHPQGQSKYPDRDIIPS
jgi:hypothetical protein